MFKGNVKGSRVSPQQREGKTERQQSESEIDENKTFGSQVHDVAGSRNSVGVNIWVEEMKQSYCKGHFKEKSCCSQERGGHVKDVQRPHALHSLLQQFK